MTFRGASALAGDSRNTRWLMHSVFLLLHLEILMNSLSARMPRRYMS
jgi:hypothetical protein